MPKYRTSRLRAYDDANREVAHRILERPALHQGLALEWARASIATQDFNERKEHPHMPIFAKAGASFVPAPAGTHAAVCVDVVDHGMLEVTYQGKTQRKHKITIAWQIAEDMDNGQPFLVRRRYTCSLHEKAVLRKDLESWRGRGFSDLELQAFDVENLLSIGCLINIIHETRNGSTYANVASVMRLPKGMTAPTPRDYIRVCDRPATPTDGAEDGLGITDDDVPF